MHIIHSITLLTSTGDGQPIGAYRTRTMADRGLLICDAVESSDMDAFKSTPVNSQPGITVELHTQEGPNHCVPDILWLRLWEGICEQIQTRAMIRRSTCERIQFPINTIPALEAGGDRPVLATFCPKELIAQIKAENLVQGWKDPATIITLKEDDAFNLDCTEPDPDLDMPF